VPTPLAREHLTELHCIQPITNVESILELGILSHLRAEKVPHVSVAMEEIQERRTLVKVPGTGRRLHSYANVYVNARNKMMFKLVRDPDYADHDELCVLRIALDVLDEEGVIIADRNASTDHVKFRPAPDGLTSITKELVFARYWNHDDPIEKQRHGALICAEVLVPDVVHPDFITGAYVSCEAAADDLRDGINLPDGFTVTIDADLFFQ
jgi:ssDNA thymidine ADP-ribosyltransferase, DarT